MQNTRSQVDSVLPYSTHWAYYNVASILSRVSNTDMNNIADNLDYNKELTREEVASILHSGLTPYLQPTTVSSMDFKDNKKITKQIQVAYCVELGLFHGDNHNKFNPTKTITRAELTSVLLRLDNLLNKK